MSVNVEAPSLSPEWVTWLRDYSATARRFTEDEPVHVSSEEERELVAIKAALYARALTLFDGALLLIENDRQLDFRIQSRGIIEAAMYLIALDRDPAYVEKMKDDDYKNRHARAGLHLKAKKFTGSDDVRKMLEDFVAQGLQGAKQIQMGDLLNGSDFERLYHSYRNVSGDAAHVSITSLNRHYIENRDDQSALLIVDPALDENDMLVTVTELGFSMILATLFLMKIKERTDLWDDFQDLTRRYRELGHAARHHVPDEHAQPVA
ncbi:DUF5677 domain-containing protein [Mesorhizobium sp. B1-1-8]|uniref:DUF5677 domain-containing protein n=1 Tax=Mesorhizobium sp. B1-1-8 TaxID=2589976 RepID=UPI001125D9A8|nr:DUF5677 domain-containing protein [Mesorhizobium sp. B1-1-8]UCI05237.1 DUF5677 domain-containing protein [Mesorhizobium sp. B1-1-8]